MAVGLASLSSYELSLGTKHRGIHWGGSGLRPDIREVLMELGLEEGQTAWWLMRWS